MRDRDKDVLYYWREVDVLLEVYLMRDHRKTHELNPARSATYINNELNENR